MGKQIGMRMMNDGNIIGTLWVSLLAASCVCSKRILSRVSRKISNGFLKGRVLRCGLTKLLLSLGFYLGFTRVLLGFYFKLGFYMNGFQLTWVSFREPTFRYLRDDCVHIFPNPPKLLPYHLFKPEVITL